MKRMPEIGTLGVGDLIRFYVPFKQRDVIAVVKWVGTVQDLEHSVIYDNPPVAIHAWGEGKLWQLRDNDFEIVSRARR